MYVYAGGPGSGPPFLRGIEGVCGMCVCVCRNRFHDLHPWVIVSAPDEMYTLEQVNDMGPWNGFYYFNGWKMKVEPKTLINKYILPNGPIYRLMEDNFYSYNKKQGADVDEFLAKVREHEKKHSELAERALLEHDPARRLERAFDTDRGRLDRNAKEIIVEADGAIRKDSGDPLALRWRGNLFMVNEDTMQWQREYDRTGEPGGKW